MSHTQTHPPHPFSPPPHTHPTAPPYLPPPPLQNLGARTNSLIVIVVATAAAAAVLPLFPRLHALLAWVWVYGVPRMRERVPPIFRANSMQLPSNLCVRALPWWWWWWWWWWWLTMTMMTMMMN